MIEIEREISAGLVPEPAWEAIRDGELPEPPQAPGLELSLRPLDADWDSRILRHSLTAHQRPGVGRIEGVLTESFTVVGGDGAGGRGRTGDEAAEGAGSGDRSGGARLGLRASSAGFGGEELPRKELGALLEAICEQRQRQIAEAPLQTKAPEGERPGEEARGRPGLSLPGIDRLPGTDRLPGADRLPGLGSLEHPAAPAAASALGLFLLLILLLRGGKRRSELTINLRLNG